MQKNNIRKNLPSGRKESSEVEENCAFFVLSWLLRTGCNASAVKSGPTNSLLNLNGFLLKLCYFCKSALREIVLGALAQSPKAPVAFVMSVHPFFRMYERVLLCTGFREFSIENIMKVYREYPNMVKVCQNIGLSA